MSAGKGDKHVSLRSAIAHILRLLHSRLTHRSTQHLLRHAKKMRQLSHQEIIVAAFLELFEKFRAGPNNESSFLFYPIILNVIRNQQDWRLPLRSFSQQLLPDEKIPVRVLGLARISIAWRNLLSNSFLEFRNKGVAVFVGERVTCFPVQDSREGGEDGVIAHDFS
ncbi:hypothetical protein TU94_09765 [Streptomyces cyaneogriseus subsp. noncyanogenus]|uniref:Uncharacterized protein n=1 Tax=Streptomyces cyaneogriseus subsp. noncyanogenus TaxID=477245 RepID=A0A0C5FVN0_9ACTN|nr:hypothetical protein TU94_09765 [Streptomyces cyaneogriseus subsp. noncyanogenus]